MAVSSPVVINHVNRKLQQFVIMKDLDVADDVYVLGCKVCADREFQKT